jgi:hypothetical protein
MRSRILPLPTMKKHTLVYFLAIAAASVSSPVLAGAGQTGVGVTTTTGTIDPTAATQNVQSQSSNFVQENQATQAGQTGMPASSVISATGTVTSRTGAAGTTPNGDASNAATGKPGDPNNPAGANAPQASAPAVPAAPPPEYVSNIKKVNRDGTSSGVAVVDTATTSGTAAGASSTPIAAAVANSTPADNVVGAPGAQRQNSAATPRVPRAADATKVSATDRTPQQPAAQASGSGSAPDSYAFYVGIVVAGLLLAFAASTFFRSDKGSVK